MKVDFKDCSDDLAPLFEFLLGFRMLYFMSLDKNNDQVLINCSDKTSTQRNDVLSDAHRLDGAH